MSEDKRKVSTDALETLGMKIGPEEKRDAIHLAVIPMVAKEILKPGDHLTAYGRKVHPEEHFAGAIGIVDPFLTEDVNPRERFWMIIYPRQIHTLRHVWTHPAFPDEVTEISSEEIYAKNCAIIEKSKQWMEDFAKTIAEHVEDEKEDYTKVVILNYDTLMEKTKRWIDEGKSIDTWDSDMYTRKFWDHYEIITGERVDEELKINFFECSC